VLSPVVQFVQYLSVLVFTMFFQSHWDHQTPSTSSTPQSQLCVSLKNLQLLQLAVVGPRLPLAGRPNRITSGVCIGITWLGAVLLGLYHLWEALGLPGSGG
jgi:hypothetical protein